MSEERQAGEIVTERYRLERKLGEGGMGEVWAAVHRVTKKPVALKFLKGEASKDAAMARRFLREARAASAVRHPNVVQVHDVLELPNGEFVIVMDFLRGEDLGQLIERKGALSLTETATILVPALRALRAAHAAGIVHRDLKPDNLFLDRTADDEVQPKLLDFGIAKLTKSNEVDEQSMKLTQTGTLMGTPFYMSPEQVYGEGDLDSRSDVWTMGVILYECLTGTKPFHGDNFGQLFKAITQASYVPLRQAAAHLPQNVTDTIEGMLQVDRTRRVPNIDGVIDTLAPHVGGQAISVAPSGPVRVVSPTETEDTLLVSDVGDTGALGSTSRRGWMLGLGAAGVLSATFIGFWLNSTDANDPPEGASATAVDTTASNANGDEALRGPEPGQVVAGVQGADVPAASAAETPASMTPPKPSSAPKPLSARSAERSRLPALIPSTRREPATPAPAAPRLPGSVVADTPF